MTSALISMAILTVNSDRLNLDTLENFVPIVLDRLHQARTQPVSSTALKDAILAEYQINMPLNVVNSILRRCKKRGFLKYENAILVTDRDRLENCSLTEIRREARSKHQHLMEEGVIFARDAFQVDMTTAQMASEIQAYIQAHAAPLLSAVIDAEPLVAEVASESRGQLIVSAFISRAIDDPIAFDYLRDVVKGSLLMSALYFSDSTIFEQKMTELHAYFDTTVLLRAVGACGPNLRLASTELLDLARKRGIKLHCFAHTVDEMRGVLVACRRAVKSRNGWYNGEATEYMVSQGWDSSEVLQLSDELEERLEALGVDVREKPQYDAAFMIDEAGLEAALENKLRYKNPMARQRDVDSASAIFTLRRGRETTRLAKAGAVFITSNTDLTRAVRTFSRIDEYDREAIPVFLADYVFTTVLWLSAPLSAPELPLRELVADCYATMRGPDAPWRQYVDKIERLRKEGRVTPERYVMLRQSLLVRSQIMLATDFDASMFTEAAADMVLARAQRNMYQEVLRSLEVERRESAATQASHLDSLKELSDKLAESREQMEEAAAAQQAMIGRVTRALAILVFALTAGLSVVGALFSLPAFSDFKTSGIVGVCLAICTGLVAGLGLASLLTGKAGPDFGRWLEKKLRPLVENALRR